MRQFVQFWLNKESKCSENGQLLDVISRSGVHACTCAYTLNMYMCIFIHVHVH